MYEFGPFRLDPDQKLLFRGDQRLELDRKALAVLDALVRNKGQLVTKDQLLGDVWGDVSVEEGNVGVHVSRIRKVLGDESRQAKYIETVHGEGIASLPTSPRARKRGKKNHTQAGPKGFVSYWPF